MDVQISSFLYLVEDQLCSPTYEAINYNDYLSPSYPSKSKLIYFYVSHDNSDVRLCNQDVHIVAKEIHLGNYMYIHIHVSENIYDRQC